MAHLHIALIHWELVGADFLGKRYGRAHTWTFDGGVVVPASSSPHVVPVPMSDASAVDPEEAFVASLASCHMLWFLDIASRAGFVVESYEDAADGRMGRNAAGKLVVDVVTLRVPGYMSSKVGDAVHVKWAAEATHLFDGDTDKRIG